MTTEFRLCTVTCYDVQFWAWFIALHHHKNTYFSGKITLADVTKHRSRKNKANFVSQPSENEIKRTRVHIVQITANSLQAPTAALARK